MKRLRGLEAQLLFFVILPLFLVLSAVALGSVFVHQRSMRTMVGERDLRAVLTAAEGLSVQPLAADQTLPHAALRILARLQANPQTIIMLVNQDGAVVFHTSPNQVGLRVSHSGILQALAGQTGILYVSDIPGADEHVVAYSPVSFTAAGGQPQMWALILEEPWREVASPWLRTSLIAPLVLLPAVASALAALWLGVRRIIRPLQQLDAQVTALGWGDFQAVEQPVGGLEGIRELQKAVATMAAQIRTYQESMHGYVDTVMATQEEERKRLARDLHDDTIQGLIALKQRIQAARRNPNQGLNARETQLAELQAMVDDILAEVRRLSRALRPLYLEEAGLVAALEALARETSRDTLDVSFEVTGEPRRLAPGTELAIYRIVQEALNNSARHAGARQVNVGVTFADPGVTVRVQDDGRGFVVPKRVTGLVEAGHYRLMGMQERARLAGAQLTIESQPGGGTTIEMILP